MYKIFFKDSALFLTDQIENDLTHDFTSIYKFGNHGELKKFINNFVTQETGKSAFIYYHDLEALFRHFKSCFLNIAAAGGLVWNPAKTHFLGITRLGRSDLPKGKLEPGETTRQAALREVTEECGISPLTITKPLGSTFHVYRLNKSLVLKETHWFEMSYNASKPLCPQAEENITEARWTSLPETKDFLKTTYPSIREVFNFANIE